MRSERADERDSAAGDVLQHGPAGVRALPQLPGNARPRGKARKHRGGLYWGRPMGFLNVDPKHF